MTILKKLSIEHYRWFFDEQSLEFWIPDNEKPWSWLTVITWPNNTWKTSIIESILIWEQSKKFFDEDIHPWKNPKITFLQNDNEEVVFTNVEGWSLVQKIWNNNTKIAPVFSRRYRNHETNWDWGESVYYNMILWKQNIRDNAAQDLIPLLKELNKSPRKLQFNKILKKILPNINSRTIWTNHIWDYVKYTTTLWNVHSSSSLWDWVLSVFVICAVLSSWQFDRHTIIIDEPELSLHPQAQKRLANMLSEESKRRQVIICTHSPYFINRRDFLNGAKFIRLNKYEDKKCTISWLINGKNYESFIWTSIEEYQKPQLFDLSAKEIMFSEGILFVEWQEDVWLIRKYTEENKIELNFDIFWYGVWWYSNMNLFLEIAKDLWISKVWILYDDWIDTTIDFNNLQNVYTEYLFKKLDTNDIRDKPDKWKFGIFYKKWTIKDEFKSGFEWIINNFKEYFNQRI